MRTLVRERKSMGFAERVGFSAYEGFTPPPAAGAEILRPNADYIVQLKIYPNTGEDHYEDVDDIVSDDDTTYVYWDEWSIKADYYTTPNSAVGAGTITSVEIHAVLRHTGSSGTEIVGLLCGTVASGGTGKNVRATNSWAEYSEVWATSPVTGLPWTWAEINDLRVGIRMPRASRKDVRCTQLWAVVNYG